MATLEFLEAGDLAFDPETVESGLDELPGTLRHLEDGQRTVRRRDPVEEA
jgi:hypothetical protein